MTDTLITKSQAVLDRIDTPGDAEMVSFEWRYDGTNELLMDVCITVQMWEELDSPQQITVTTVAGDKIKARRSQTAG